MKGVNWQDEHSVVATPFKFFHMIIIAILFMILGSYLARQTNPLPQQFFPEPIVETIEPEQLEEINLTEL